MNALTIGLHVLAVIIHIAALFQAMDCGLHLKRLTPNQFAARAAVILGLFALATTVQVLA